MDKKWSYSDLVQKLLQMFVREWVVEKILVKDAFVMQEPKAIPLAVKIIGIFFGAQLEMIENHFNV